ncbi:hypothetical protein BKH43_07075 [Helicobacter sp. 13S00401-1]|uniref:hypothetical protein n=1 Tax=Helicobacter sp. 13S00401-1 TaxID=1905758 RepID=UPI000BA66980|nr:hypothetical protein [Helicobacter sp. 13S00401-1]PAF49281.1 hypothetical protein BKH43_07075 [Helicobacter sp. 13S00401-1]
MKTKVLAFTLFLLALLAGCASTNKVYDLGKITSLTPSKDTNVKQTKTLSEVCYKEVFFIKSKANKPLTLTSLLESSPKKSFQDVSIWHYNLNFGHIYTRTCLELKGKGGAK